MSILSDVINLVKNGSEEQSSTQEHPCDNCPSNCSLCPDACEACKPYKKKLIDAIYWVDHREELNAKYEVTSAASDGTGSTVCPYCGGPSENAYVCDYCGMKIQDGSAKIRVASVSDIPNPVLEARDIIYERYANVVAKYGDTSSLDTSSGSSLLGSLANMIFSKDDSDSESNPLGSKMTEQEITDTAAAYGVSVSSYLTGLDAGTYLTAAAKSKSEKYSETAGSVASGVAGVAGVAGAAGVIGSLIGNRSSSSNNRYNTGRDMPPPPMDRDDNGNSGNGFSSTRNYRGNSGNSNSFSSRGGNNSGMNRGPRGGQGGGMGRGPQGGPGGGMGRGPRGGGGNRGR